MEELMKLQAEIESLRQRVAALENAHAAAQKPATAIVNLDGKTLARAILPHLSDAIRSQSGIRSM